MTKGNGSIGDGKHTQVAIGDQDGKVVMAFDRSITKLVLDPENARQIGGQLVKSAYTAHTGVQVTDVPAAIKEHTRSTLIHRFILVDRNLREQGKSPGYIAQQLVDLFLSEVS
jgi:hypothetical protein